MGLEAGLNGQLVEGEPPQDRVHLAHLDEDMGETANLKDEFPILLPISIRKQRPGAGDIENAGHLTAERQNGTTGYVED